MKNPEDPILGNHEKTIDTREMSESSAAVVSAKHIVKYCLLGKRILLVGVKLMKIDGEMHSEITMVHTHQMVCVSTL